MPRLTPDQHDTRIEQEGSCAESNTLMRKSFLAGIAFASIGSIRPNEPVVRFSRAWVARSIVCRKSNSQGLPQIPLRFRIVVTK